MIGKYELFGERMAQVLRERPADEPLWQALRRVFDLTLVYFEDGPERERNDAMERMVRSNPNLYAAYLERIARAQDPVVEVARERLGDDPSSPTAAMRALVVVGAAFACVTAAQKLWHESGGKKPFGELLDAAMDGLQPNF